MSQEIYNDQNKRQEAISIEIIKDDLPEDKYNQLIAKISDLEEKLKELEKNKTPEDSKVKNDDHVNEIIKDEPIEDFKQTLRDNLTKTLNVIFRVANGEKTKAKELNNDKTSWFFQFCNNVIFKNTPLVGNFAAEVLNALNCNAKSEDCVRAAKKLGISADGKNIPQVIEMIIDHLVESYSSQLALLLHGEEYSDVQNNLNKSDTISKGVAFVEKMKRMIGNERKPTSAYDLAWYITYNLVSNLLDQGVFQKYEDRNLCEMMLLFANMPNSGFYFPRDLYQRFIYIQDGKGGHLGVDPFSLLFTREVKQNAESYGKHLTRYNSVESGEAGEEGSELFKKELNSFIDELIRNIVSEDWSTGRGGHLVEIPKSLGVKVEDGQALGEENNQAKDQKKIVRLTGTAHRVYFELTNLLFDEETRLKRAWLALVYGVNKGGYKQYQDSVVRYQALLAKFAEKSRYCAKSPKHLSMMKFLEQGYVAAYSLERKQHFSRAIEVEKKINELSDDLDKIYIDFQKKIGEVLYAEEPIGDEAGKTILLTKLEAITQLEADKRKELSDCIRNWKGAIDENALVMISPDSYKPQKIQRTETKKTLDEMAGHLIRLAENDVTDESQSVALLYYGKLIRPEGGAFLKEDLNNYEINADTDPNDQLQLAFEKKLNTLRGGVYNALNPQNARNIAKKNWVQKGDNQEKRVFLNKWTAIKMQEAFAVDLAVLIEKWDSQFKTSFEGEDNLLVYARSLFWVDELVRQFEQRLASHNQACQNLGVKEVCFEDLPSFKTGCKAIIKNRTLDLLGSPEQLKQGMIARLLAKKDEIERLGHLSTPLNHFVDLALDLLQQDFPQAIEKGKIIALALLPALTDFKACLEKYQQNPHEVGSDESKKWIQEKEKALKFYVKGIEHVLDEPANKSCLDVHINRSGSAWGGAVSFVGSFVTNTNTVNQLNAYRLELKQGVDNVLQDVPLAERNEINLG